MNQHEDGNHKDTLNDKNGTEKKEITFADMSSEDSEEDNEKKEEEKPKPNKGCKNRILRSSSFRLSNDRSGGLDAEYRYDFTPY